MTWTRLFWLLLFVPLQATADMFTWLAGFPYDRLYRENGRIREQRRQALLAKRRAEQHSGRQNSSSSEGT